MHGHKIVNQNGLHFLTFTVVGWVDVFTRQKHRDIVIEDLRHCIKHKGLNLYAFVIMSNHIHIIASAAEGHQLSEILRDLKGHISRAIIKELIETSEESRREWILRLLKYYAKYNKNNKKYQFWKQGSMPIELTSPKWIITKLNYIHNNPVNAGIVTLPEHFIYSSASNYVIGSGLLDVKLIDLGFTGGYIDT